MVGHRSFELAVRGAVSTCFTITPEADGVCTLHTPLGMSTQPAGAIFNPSARFEASGNKMDVGGEGRAFYYTPYLTS